MNQFSRFKFLLLASFLVTSTMLHAQNETILTIGNKTVTRAEFERIYKKNNTQVRDEKESKTPAEYMEMFINFKLKVLEAQKQGYDTTALFKQELAQYRNELAQPYLTDVSFTEATVKDMYERTVNEVRASHILIRIDESAEPADTLVAWNKVMDIRKDFVEGKKTFAELASQHSEDPSVARNQGDLGFFKAFQMVTPFEDAAFTTPVGEISMPIRTRFGYHIIYVADKRPAQGEILVAHIMKMFSNPEHVTAEEDQQLKAKADSIYKIIQNGGDFAELARTYSDDKRSGMNGGEMQWFSAGQIDPDFSREAFALKNNGDVSPVIRSRFGYHIIKRIDHKMPPKFEDIKDELEQRVKSNPDKSKHNRQLFVEKLKKEYRFQFNDATMHSLKTVVESDKYDSVQVLALKPYANRSLFIFAGKTYNVADFLEWTTDAKKIERKTFMQRIDPYVEAMIIKYEDSKLEDKYTDFKYLVQEYHDGILLFSIMEKQVWNKAIEDSLGLVQFYENNKNRFAMGEHFDGLVIHCKSQTARDSVETLLASGLTNPKELEERMNESSSNRIRIEKGRWEKGDHKIVDFYVWNGQAPAKFDDKLEFIYGNKINSGYKTLDEARGLFISEYQDFLEKEWLNQIRNSNKIVVNKKVLKKIKQ
jgi:peptidyl-prolyl cis-trans isomerase SurA